MALQKTSTAGTLPLDVLPLILEHLTDRRDLCTCALLSRGFNHAATPLLYRTLDVRVVTRGRLQVSVSDVQVVKETVRRTRRILYGLD